MEIWRDIAGYEGTYQVSDQGRVRRLAGTPYCKEERTLTSKPGHRYARVVLALNGKHRTFYVHHLVANAFLGGRPDGWEVNHKNGSKWDNRLTNLEYVTRAQNVEHCRVVLQHYLRGEDSPAARLSEDEVLNIRRMVAQGSSHRKAAQQYGVDRATVGLIIRHETWTHI